MIMFMQRLKAARALLVLAALLGTTAACSANNYHAAPYVSPDQPQPMYVPGGGG
jgi:hypothetical protein